jgi:acetoacetyl-CoA reductase
MARVALVTGGSRGIGAAISKALKAAGYKVAANYAGNDDAAAVFKTETGIPVYKWSVADYDACVAGVQKVEADLGPIDVLVNNAGITRHQGHQTLMQACGRTNWMGLGINFWLLLMLK